MYDCRNDNICQKDWYNATININYQIYPDEEFSILRPIEGDRSDEVAIMTKFDTEEN